MKKAKIQIKYIYLCMISSPFLLARIYQICLKITHYRVCMQFICASSSNRKEQPI